MSRFYASIQGERGEATRQGHHSITGHVRGWDVGVKVRGTDDNGEGGKSGADTFLVYATTGSNGYGSGQLIAIVKLGEFGLEVEIFDLI